MLTFFTFLFLLHLTLCSTSKPTLKGKQIRCCTLEQYPSVFRDDSLRDVSFGLDGIGINYLSQLEEYIGFRCSSVKSYTADRVGFTEFINRMHACSVGNSSVETDDICKCELGTGGWTQTEERYDSIHFLVPFIHDSMQTVTHVNNTNKSSGGAFFLIAFSAGVWLTILGLIVAFVILKLVDSKFAPIALMTDMTSKSIWDKFWFRVKRWRSAIRSVVENLLGRSFRPFIGDAGAMRSWTLNILISLCGIFLILAWEAGMVANLVQERLESPYESLNDFRFCKIAANEVCIYGFGSTAEFWRKSIAPAIKQNCPGSDTMPQLYGFFEHAIGNVSTGGNGCKYLFGDGMTAIAAVNGRYCGKLVQVGEQVYPGRQGFIAPLGWKREYIDEINKATYHLAERNRLESLENFVKKTTNCQVKQNSTVNLSTLKIFFICAFGSCFLLLVHMRLNPQKIHDNEALQSSMHNQAGDLTNMVNVEEDSSMV